MGHYPIGGVEAIAAQHEVSVVDMDAEKVDGINEILSPFEIPAGVYSGQDQEVITIGMPAFLWFRDDLSEEQVYEITKTIFERMDEIISVDHIAEQSRLLTKEEVEAFGIELHPGVLKYVEEIGLWE